MKKVILNKIDLSMAYKTAVYLDCPEIFSYDEKEELREVRERNPLVWEKAFQIYRSVLHRRNVWRKDISKQ